MTSSANNKPSIFFFERMDGPERTSAEGQELDQLPRVEQDVKQSEVEGEYNHENPWRHVAQRTFRHEHLERALERPQLTGIYIILSTLPATF